MGKSSKLDSAMFRDESRAPKAKSDKVKSEVKSEKYKSVKKKEVKKEKKIVEEDFTEEPDFSDFQSKYVVPEKMAKKVEKKPEKKPEKNDEKSKKPEPVATPKKYESVKYESKKLKSTAFKSNPNFKTTFTDDRDIEMAEKQTMIAELEGKELKEQEEWALEKLKAHAGTCPMGFNWYRYTEEACGEQVRLDGYRCKGLGHFVSHEMVAKGEGETMNVDTNFFVWEQSTLQPGIHVAPYTGVRWRTEGEEYQRPVGGLGSLLLQQMVAAGPPQLFGGLPAGRGGFGNFPFGNPNQNLHPHGSLQDRLKHHKGHQPGGNGGFTKFGGFGGQQPPPGGFPGFGGFGGHGQNGSGT